MLEICYWLLMGVGEESSERGGGKDMDLWVNHRALSRAHALNTQMEKSAEVGLTPKICSL